MSHHLINDRRSQCVSNVLFVLGLFLQYRYMLDLRFDKSNDLLTYVRTYLLTYASDTYRTYVRSQEVRHQCTLTVS